MRECSTGRSTGSHRGVTAAVLLLGLGSVRSLLCWWSRRRHTVYTVLRWGTRGPFSDTMSATQRTHVSIRVCYVGGSCSALTLRWCAPGIQRHHGIGGRQQSGFRQLPGECNEVRCPCARGCAIAITWHTQTDTCWLVCDPASLCLTARPVTPCTRASQTRIAPTPTAGDSAPSVATEGGCPP